MEHDTVTGCACGEARWHFSSDDVEELTARNDDGGLSLLRLIRLPGRQCRTNAPGRVGGSLQGRKHAGLNFAKKSPEFLARHEKSRRVSARGNLLVGKFSWTLSFLRRRGAEAPSGIARFRARFRARPLAPDFGFAFGTPDFGNRT